MAGAAGDDGGRLYKVSGNDQYSHHSAVRIEALTRRRCHRAKSANFSAVRHTRYTSPWLCPCSSTPCNRAHTSSYTCGRPPRGTRKQRRCRKQMHGSHDRRRNRVKGTFAQPMHGACGLGLLPGGRGSKVVPQCPVARPCCRVPRLSGQSYTPDGNLGGPKATSSPPTLRTGPDPRVQLPTTVRRRRPWHRERGLREERLAARSLRHAWWKFESV